MSGITVDDVVVVHCREPREKVWGLLLQLDGVGVCLRGMDLGSVEDWLLQERSDGESILGPSTFFFPLHRVQRIDLDESQIGGVVAFAEKYRDACGRDVREALLAGDSAQGRP